MCRNISAFILYSMCIIIIDTQNFQLANTLELKNPEWSARNTIDQLEYSFSLNNKCSRYCIQRRQNQSFKHAIILWNILRDTLILFNDGIIKFSSNSNNVNLSTKCVLYVNINCNNFTFNSKTTNYNMTDDDNNEKTFFVHNGTKILKSQVAVNRNVSSFLLEIPLGSNQIENNDILELSLNIDNDGNNLYILMSNPPPGKWRLKFIDIGINKSIDPFLNNYGIMAVQTSKNSMTTKKRLNLPLQIESRNAEYIETNIAEKANNINFDDDNLEDINELAKIVSNGERDVINEKSIVMENLMQLTNEVSYQIRNVQVDLAPETKLFATPGTTHLVVFTVKNYLPITMVYTFYAFSTSFPILSILQPLKYAGPHEIFKVFVYIAIPNVNENIVNTVTLRVEHESSTAEVTKSVYITLQNTAVADYVKPKISYSFNNNCAGKLDQENCNDSEWSAKITVTDNESGVKNVFSTPDGIRPKQTFIAGMKGTVDFLYHSSCCYAIVQITAIDATGNSYTREIDVTAWDNLTTGDIAAITIGTLFLLFIIILFVVLCIYCIKRRKSQDISFTQRYASNPRTERTDF